jgi:hypothetical protein
MWFLSDDADDEAGASAARESGIEESREFAHYIE